MQGRKASTSILVMNIVCAIAWTVNFLMHLIRGTSSGPILILWGVLAAVWIVAAVLWYIRIKKDNAKS